MQKTVFKLPQNLTRSVSEIDSALAGGNSDLAVDFSPCQFITVDGLEWLEELLLRAASSSTHVGFINVQPNVYKVFKVARIASILNACESHGLS